jgi:hypothetical protein
LQEQKYVDDFGRMDNIKKLSKACTELITVTTCGVTAESGAAAPAPPLAPGTCTNKDAWPVCVKSGTKAFGKVSGKKPDGIIVSADGTCEVMEYAGGFDGFFSTDAGDGHENGFATAAMLMLGEKGCLDCGLNQPVNARVNKFLGQLRDDSKPIDFDYPEVWSPPAKLCAAADWQGSAVRGQAVQ